MDKKSYLFPVLTIILAYFTGIVAIYILEYNQILSELDSLHRIILDIGIYSIITIPIIIVLIRLMNRIKKKLYRYFYTDQLTLLNNREKLIADIVSSNNPILIYIDIDNFKEINSFYGYEVASFLLIAVANRLKYLLKDNVYHIYKLHGDVYAVLMDKEFKLAETTLFMEYLSAGINGKDFIFHDHYIGLNVTIGVASGKPKELKPGESLSLKLISRAEIALKEAKINSKDFVFFCDKFENSTAIKRNIDIARQLRKAIRHDNILVYYQPIINNLTGKIGRYECLVRLRDDRNEILSPFVFLDISEKTRLYHYITTTVIQKSFEHFENNQFGFSINISFSDIKNESIVEFIFNTLKKYPKAAKRVAFEILESEGIQNFEKVKTFVSEVKKFGVKIAVDDFGSGYSNFETIAKLNVDYLKIDGSLIKNLDKDVHCEIITQSITHFAKKLGLKTIGEFVCNREVYEKVLNIGLDYSQGYFFGKPEPELMKREDALNNIRLVRSIVESK